jgi:uncharacterized protein YndB with AHSA1/START domain
VVFRYFTDTARWANYWGEGSSVDATVGGTAVICFPGGIEVRGEVVEIAAPNRFVFTYGFATGTPIPAGSSRVTIQLAADPTGTKLSLRHAFAEGDAATRDEHVQGWRYQLSVLANVVSDEAHAGSADVVDRWFAAWAEPDAQLRAETITGIASPHITFTDRYSNLESLTDLLAHITASQKFMPGIRMTRTEPVRHCQGMVLAEWSATDAGGASVSSGTNVFVFGSGGRLESVTGFVR